MASLKRYMIERDIPGIGNFSVTELCGAARASNQALSTIGPAIQWQHSYVAGNKTFCVYLADSENNTEACRTQRHPDCTDHRSAADH